MTLGSCLSQLLNNKSCLSDRCPFTKPILEFVVVDAVIGTVANIACATTRSVTPGHTTETHAHTQAHTHIQMSGQISHKPQLNPQLSPQIILPGMERDPNETQTYLPQKSRALLRFAFTACLGSNHVNLSDLPTIHVLILQDPQKYQGI